MLEPKRPEGYFWMAADMGALAESFGLRQGLKYRGDIKDGARNGAHARSRRFRRDQPIARSGAGTSKCRGCSVAARRSRRSTSASRSTYDPNSIASHLFLAETLFDMDRDADAREELRKTIAAPVDPEWEPEEREFKKLAEERLKKK